MYLLYKPGSFFDEENQQRKQFSYRRILLENLKNAMFGLKPEKENKPHTIQDQFTMGFRTARQINKLENRRNSCDFPVLQTPLRNLFDEQ